MGAEEVGTRLGICVHLVVKVGSAASQAANAVSGWLGLMAAILPGPDQAR